MPISFYGGLSFGGYGVSGWFNKTTGEIYQNILINNCDEVIPCL